MLATKQELIYKIIEQHYNSGERDGMYSRAVRQVGEFWAEDCVQTAYERAMRYHIRLPIDYVGINRYMQIVLTNVIRDFVNEKFEQVEIEEQHWESGELLDQEMAKESLDKILEYMKTFSEATRGVLYTVLVQGEKISDTSQVFGINENTIKTLCMRFREDIRERFQIE